MLWHIIKGVVCLLALLSLTGPAMAAEKLSEDRETANIAAINKMFFPEEQDFSSATHFLKPLRQVPENVTIITDADIEAMNARTVLDVLQQGAGMFIWFNGHDFGSSGYLEIQGSSEDQVLVLLDGIRLNSLASGLDDSINGLPVRIVKRIEIIKGPASSSWGSSLGGVINIITRAPGTIDLMHGTVSASYGEGNTRQFHGEAYGHDKQIGYYLYAGRQASDGLRDNRYFESNSFFAKVGVRLPKRMELNLSLGSITPKWKDVDYWDYDYSFTNDATNHWASVAFDAPLTDNLSFNLSLHALTREHDYFFTILGGK